MDVCDLYLYDLKTKFDKLEDKSKWYLSYSGGKDSHLLYWFIKEYLKDNKIEIIGINTYMEHKEIRERIYNNSNKILLPTKKPFEIKEKYGTPCFSKEQDFYIYYYQKALREGREPAKTYIDKIMGTYRTGYGLSKKAREYVLSGNAHMITHLCCYYLKKEPAHRFEKETGKNCILGVKSGESTLRKRQYNSCFSKNKSRRVFTPLWDLTEELEDKIYKKYNIEIPKVYESVCRTGCMGCPYGSYKGDTQKELELIDDVQKKFVCDYFKESYEILGVKI